MQRSLPKKSHSIDIISLPNPLITTPQLTDNTSPPPPNYNFHNSLPNNLSPRHSQLPLLSSPPYIHNSICSEDTSFDNSSNIFPRTTYGNQAKFTLLLYHLRYPINCQKFIQST